MVKEKFVYDLGLAAYLQFKGHVLIRTPFKKAVNRTVFVFEENDTIEKDILQFFNRTALVEPQTILQFYNNLKNFIHSEVKGVN